MGKALIVIIPVVFSVYSLFDVLAQSRTRSLSKPLWAVLALVPILGPIGWLALGRPPATRPGAGGRPAPRVSGPDDDPDFLWNLNRRKRPSHGSDEDPPAQKE